MPIEHPPRPDPVQLLALAVRAAVLAEQERLALARSGRTANLDSGQPRTMVVRIPPRQTGPSWAWVFTGPRDICYFRGSFRVGA